MLDIILWEKGEQQNNPETMDIKSIKSDGRDLMLVHRICKGYMFMLMDNFELILNETKTGFFVVEKAIK